MTQILMVLLALGVFLLFSILFGGAVLRVSCTSSNAPRPAYSKACILVAIIGGVSLVGQIALVAMMGAMGGNVFFGGSVEQSVVGGISLSISALIAGAVLSASLPTTFARAMLIWLFFVLYCAAIGLTLLIGLVFLLV